MYKFTPYFKLFLILIAFVIVYLYLSRINDRKPEDDERDDK